jgi:hypothetical protein
MAIAFSIAAVVIAASTFMASLYRDRRDLLLRFLEYLGRPDQQLGRRLIYDMAEAETRVEDLGERYELINGALSALNVLAIYYERRYIRRKDVLEYWASNVVRTYEAADAFLAHRGTFTGRTPWPQLDLLARDAQTYLQRTEPGAAAGAQQAESSQADL